MVHITNKDDTFSHSRALSEEFLDSRLPSKNYFDKRGHPTTDCNLRNWHTVPVVLVIIKITQITKLGKRHSMSSPLGTIFER